MPTRQPTYTPQPTYTALPTRAAGLTRDALTIHFATNVATLLGSDGVAKNNERQQIRKFINSAFGAYEGKQTAGIVLTFGTAPDPTEGNRLASAVNQLLREELPGIFSNSVFRDFHFISPNSARHGEVEIEVYFLMP